MPDTLEGHQASTDGDDDDQQIDDAAQNIRLRDMLARQQIVFRIELEATQIDHRPDMHGDLRHPGDQDDQRDGEATLQNLRQSRRKRQDGLPDR